MRINSQTFYFAVLLGLSASVIAQTDVKPKDRPVFGQIPDGEKAPPPAKEKDAAEPESPTLRAFATWPDETAQRAARDVVAAGASMTPFLLDHLGHADWRVRATCVYALGEAKVRSAYAPIKKAMTELGNQIALAVHFAALGKIDPDVAPLDLMPFIAGGSPAVARDAFEAMPRVIAKVYAPKLHEWLDGGDDTLRERALVLLSRQDGGETWRTYFNALGDKSARIADLAARMLADRDDAEIVPALKDQATNSYGRPAAYAALALVRIEDRMERVILDGEGKFVEKMMKWLRMRGDLENAVAAISLANISMRSDKKDLRELADKYLVFQLIKSAGGGVIFADYSSVKSLCFKKAAMLTGENFGENAEQWKTWWNEAGSKFIALRRLSSLADEDLAKATIEWRRRLPAGKEFTAVFSAAAPTGINAAAARPVYIAIAEFKEIAQALRDARFFADDGAAPSDADPVVVSVRIDRAERRKNLDAAAAAALQGLESKLVAVTEREKWQLLWNPSRDGEYAAWHAKELAALASGDLSANDLHFAQKGLESFAAIDARGRRVAIDAWSRRDAAWLKGAAGRLVLFLSLKSIAPEQAKAIVRLLARVPAGPERDQLETTLLKDAAGGADSLFSEYLRAMSTDDVKAHLADRRLAVRSAALTVLADRADDPAAVLAVVEKIGSLSPETQDALTATFRGRAAPILGAVRARAGDAANPGRLQAIEILGALGTDDDVDALFAAAKDGGLSVGFAAMRGLRANGGSHAADRLLEMARTNADPTIRRESLTTLGRIDTDHVRELVRAWLKEEKDPETLSVLVSAAVPLFKKSLGAELSFLLASEDPKMRRRVTLVLATAGQKEAVPGLISLILDADVRANAEDYLHEITCKRVEGATPELKNTAWTAWWDSHKNEDSDQWFVDALHDRGLPVGDLLRYLRGEKDDPAAVPLLVHCLRLDAWELRVRAHRYLTRISGTDQGTLTRISGADDVARITEKWEKWLHVWELH